MPRTTRTFIALPLPTAVRSKIEGLQRLLAPKVDGARWVGADSLHLTLAFLGDVADADLNALCLAVAESVRSRPRFDLNVRGVGVFPESSPPRVLWAGLDGDLEPLASLHKAVFDAAAAVGYRPTDERFHPHVTLARLKTGRIPTVDLRPIRERHREWNGGGFAVDTVVVYASTATPDGPAYVPLGRAHLAARSRA